MNAALRWSLVILFACGSDPAPPHRPENTVEAPPPAPTAASAHAALAAQRYDEVCAYLVGLRFSPIVCDFITASARGETPRMPRLDGWLEAHHVRRMHVDMYGMLLGEDNHWNIGVDGHDAILVAELGADAVVANEWELIAQRSGTREVETPGGTRTVDVYREWLLEFLIRDLARLPEHRERQATQLLSDLIDDWERDWMAPDGTSDGALPPLPAPTSPFAGTWFSSENEDVRLVLTDTTYMYRFPFQGGLRRIYANIVSHDPAARHVTLEVTRVTQDGVVDTEETLGPRYMTYEMLGESLLRSVSREAFPEEAERTYFLRIPESMVGPDDE